MTKPVVLQARAFPPKVETALQEAFEVRRLFDAPDPDALIAEVGGRVRGVANSGGAPFSNELIDRLPKLEIISGFGVGYDGVDVKYCRERGVTVTNTPDVLNDAVADLAVGLLLDVTRRITWSDRYVREGRWLKGAAPLFTSIQGRMIGIIGLGRIGKAIANRLEAFGVSIAYHGRKQQDGAPYAFYGDLTAMARDAFALIVICPGGPATEGLVSAEVIDALGADGVIVNVARGSVIDQDAMVKALVEGRLGGAGLDVFAEEPKVPEALFTLDNVVLQPHQGSATVETRAAMGQLMVDNLRAHFDGRGALTPVN